MSGFMSKVLYISSILNDIKTIKEVRIIKQLKYKEASFFGSRRYQAYLFRLNTSVIET